MTETGRRERKKAATRKAISDAATMLFIERGFDDVSVREVAEAADVSPTTVFAHFPQKEALVFDEDEELRDLLVAAVRDRASGESVSDALRRFYRRGLLDFGQEHSSENRRRFAELVESTPALRDYLARMWGRHEHALADAVADAIGESEPSTETRVYARLALQIQVMASEVDDPEAVVEEGFRILERGWSTA